MAAVQPAFPAAFIEAVRAHGAVVMAGAGVSAAPPSSLPGWYDLNARIASALGERIDRYLQRDGYTVPLCEAIDARRSADGFPPDYQAQILEENAGESYFRALQCLDVAVCNDAHHAVARLAGEGVLAAIVTTNFDRLIEHALEARGIAYQAAVDAFGYERCLEQLRSGGTGPLPLIKVHGCVSDHRSMVDTLKQRLLGRHAALDAALSSLLAGHPWLFAGFSAADLESDPEYLGLAAAASTSPGILYVQWPGEKRLTPGARHLLTAYEGKCAHLVSETAPTLDALARDLGAAPEAPVPGGPTGDPLEDVRDRLHAWAFALTPATAVSCLASIAEASGLATAAFELLHRFWKDVLPADRGGADFEHYRFHHGRLGMGGGLLGMVEDLQSEAGAESIQNLLRIAEREPRAVAWTALAWLWSGRLDRSQALLDQTGASLDSDAAPEVHVDAWLVLAEALFVMNEPEGVLDTWETAARNARAAGDLPREARVMTLAALHHAEYGSERFPDFIEHHAAPVLDRARRLNDPAVSGFEALGRGRYLVRVQAGEAALEALALALARLEDAGRPPWRIYATCELAKARLDRAVQEQDRAWVEAAADLLNGIDDDIDTYQIWLPRYYEVRGQCYRSVQMEAQARADFEAAVEYAGKLGLTRKEAALRQYLEPPRGK